MLRDIKYALRMFGRKPGFTAVILLLLILGISANTTIFSFVNATLLQPIQGVEASDRLVAVYTSDYSSGLYGGSSYPDYENFRDQNDVFTGLTAYATTSLLARIGDDFEPLSGFSVTGNYFDVLGVSADMGRTMTPADDNQAAGDAVVVISHGFWTRRFGAAPGVLGTTITMNNEPYTIIGVIAENFTGTRIDMRPDVWVPMALRRAELLTSRGARWLRMIGRLKPEVTLAQAQAQMTTIMGHLGQEYPDTNIGTLRAPGEPRPMTVTYESPLGPQMREQIGLVSILLMSVVGIVLLIACVNIANLLLARATVRRREMALRLALGANRKHLIRQLLTESMLLALAAGIMGLLVTHWAGGLIPGLLPDGDTLNLNFSIDQRMMLFTFGISILTGMVFGLIPALQSSNPSLIAGLKNEIAAPIRRFGRFGLRNVLVVVQIALSVMLLIGAGLFIRSLRNAATTDLGFNPENLLVATVDVSNAFENPEQQGMQFYSQLAERIEGLPGVKSVTLSAATPLVRWARTVFRFDGYVPEDSEDMELPFNVNGLNYFSTVGVPLIKGRSFTNQDRMGGAPVIILNETAAQRYFAGRDPIGKRVTYRRTELEVIGVAGTSKYWNIREAPKSFLYLPFLQNPRPAMRILVRTESDPLDAIPAVRTAIKDFNKNVPIMSITTLNEVISKALAIDRMMTVLSSMFGGLAMIIASIGLYGMMTYTVSQRIREIGVRIALGAQGDDVLKWIVKQGMVMAVLGVVVGIGGALAVTHFLSSMLYNVSATDPVTFTVVCALLAGIALLACYIPARRATKVDAMTALRYE